ncbi:MAG TPA: helix-turn-helix transcriptional regulator [Devosia sp.]|nr:helix-turn-helix transcriptional regulator [Devosia sp.]
MTDGPRIAIVAALIGDPARANMLTALMDGRALTVSELAQAAGVTLPTASGHLTRLDTAGLLTAQKQGRHRYFRLAGPEVAAVLEALMSLSQADTKPTIRTGPRDVALRTARICYDHLAGEQGVALLNSLIAAGHLTDAPTPAITPTGKSFFAALGLDLSALTTAKRPLCRRCLDWSERKSHLAGGLGAGLLTLMLEKNWAKRMEGRVIAFTPKGKKALAEMFATQTNCDASHAPILR